MERSSNTLDGVNENHRDTRARLEGTQPESEAPPQLTPGTRLGPYEISSLLGAGGMGEVYRARDTRLGREVAIKVLRARSQGDPESMRRFAIEARAGGVVNHANIVATYDVGVKDGMPYVVSELLAGTTLRARLESGPLPPHRALDLARQIAAGLAAAHDKGVVHRDLKPENLFVTTEGTLKILDFGVAKLLAPPASEADEGHAPTVAAHTEDGVIVGTAGYMSPEQVRALAIDARSDIFSLGAILYEMLAGRRAFAGASAIETGMAILRDEPAPLTTPIAGLDLIVSRCLEKTPAQRFQSARDLGFALEAIATPRPAVDAPAPRPPTPRRRGSRIAAFAGAIAVAAAALFGWLAGRGSSPAAEPHSYRRLTFRSGLVDQARFAPDGQIVYNARWGDRGGRSEIFTVQPDSPESRGLALPGSTQLLSVSRNGELAVLLEPSRPGLRQNAGTLARVPLAGGAPREVLGGVELADWSPDGTALAIVRSADGMDRLEYPAGTVLFETSGMVQSPRFAPDGKRIAFLHHPILSDDRGEVTVVDLEGRARPVTGMWMSVSGLAWSPRGELWFTAAAEGADAALYATTLDGRQRVVDRVPGRLTILDIAADGRVLLTRATARWAIAVHAPGETRDRDLSWFDWSYIGDFAHDGRAILFFESGQAVGANYRAYLRRADGADPVWLGQGGQGALSQDGRWAVLTQVDRPEVLQLVPTGAGATGALAAGGLSKRSMPAWFPDGKRIAFSGIEGSGPWRLYVQELDGAPRALAPQSLQLFTSRAVSPDGRFIVAHDAATRPVIVPAEGGAIAPVAGLQPGETVAHWAPGNLLYVFNDRVPAEVWRLDPATGSRERVREIHPILIAPSGLRQLFLTPDAEAYAYSFNATVTDLYLADAPR